MVEERMVALGFNNENPKKYIHVPSIQQPHGQPNKSMSQKTKSVKLEQYGFTSYFNEQGGRGQVLEMWWASQEKGFC